MLYKKSVMWVLGAGVFVLFLTSCYKDKTVLFDTGEEITRAVSFANDLIPIFNSDCNSSGCHSEGGVAPVLTTNGAYNSLSSGNYINTSNPQNSELYLWMTGKRGTPMPPAGFNKNYNALVLAWIKQGALNN
jgi:hypothetical protein